MYKRQGIEIGLFNWGSFGSRDHLIDPGSWTKYSIDDSFIRVNSQPAIVGVHADLYPGIPSTEHPVWNIYNLSDYDLEIEIQVDHRYLDTDEVYWVLAREYTVKPKFGINIDARFSSTGLRYEVTRGIDDHPGTYYSKFMGIWYKIIP